MPVNINPIDPKAAQPKKSHKSQNSSNVDFASAIKNAAKEIHTKVPESVAASKEDFRKKKLSEERDLADQEDEEEEENIDSLIKKIEQRLKKLGKLAEKDTR
ncbi:MAG: hypothetical protein KKA19_02320 [Candidatus Margulisbacteria bacterium]|nr:hypothetical protein [Candidatus Margulisiibacteriota bacterium]